MGLFSSDESEDEQEEAESYFKPVTTDRNRVLGYLHDGSGSDSTKRLVWVKESTFDTINGDEIDHIRE